MSKRDTNTGRNATPGTLMADEYYFYLHTNGELICKGQHYSWESFEESDFVKQWWIVDISNRIDCYHMLFRALMLDASPTRIEELRQKWQMTDEDTKEYCSRVKLDWVYDAASSTYTVFGITKSSLFYAVADFYDKAVNDPSFNLNFST